MDSLEEFLLMDDKVEGVLWRTGGAMGSNEGLLNLASRTSSDRDDPQDDVTSLEERRGWGRVSGDVLAMAITLDAVCSIKNETKRSQRSGPQIFLRRTINVLMATRTMRLRMLQGNEDTLGLVRPEEAGSHLLTTVQYLVPVCMILPVGPMA